MKRREFISHAAIAGFSAGSFLLAAPLRAAIKSIPELNTYFNSIRTGFSPFVQTNANGNSAGGTFYLQKPGKMRFEYDDPRYPLTVSDGNMLAIFDPKSNAGPQKYPLFQTPISLLSHDHVELTSSKFVRRINERGSDIYVTLADPDNANYGSLDVKIDKQEARLKGWDQVDQSGARSTITLSAFKTGVELDPDLFNIVKMTEALQGG